MNVERSVVDLEGVPWVAMADRGTGGGAGTRERKELVAPDGHRVRLGRVNGEAAPHFHTKASTLFIFSGEIVLRDRVAGPGCWVLEPWGAIHPRTRFNDVVYGFGMSDGDFGAGNVRLESLDDIPQWMVDAGFKVDDFASLVDSKALAWEPFDDGLSVKILHVFDGRPAFASLLRAEAGAALPRRRYVGPVDMVVLSGRAEFCDAPAGPNAWVHQPAGAEDDVVRFPVATEMLVNTYGSVLELSASGAVARVIDGYAVKRGLTACPV